MRDKETKDTTDNETAEEMLIRHLGVDRATRMLFARGCAVSLQLAKGFVAPHRRRLKPLAIATQADATSKERAQ